MKVAVLGASGYGGQVLMRLLLDHPEVESVLPVSSSAAGLPVDERDGGLGPDEGDKLPAGRRALSRDQALAEKPDAVFSALPHGVSARFSALFASNSVILDLSADFRLRDAEAHEQAYGEKLPLPALRKSAVYGLAEWYRDAIRSASIVAVPGCFPTSVLLPLLPLCRAGLLGSPRDPETRESCLSGPITVNSLTGISGAGRKAQDAYLYVERTENAVAYKHGVSHRHVWEMRQELAAAGCTSDVFFTPHLIPLRRGMLTTITMPISGDPESVAARVEDALSEAFGAELCIDLTGSRTPSVRDAAGSNRCSIGWDIITAPGGSMQLYLFSALDNLMKGASGQAVQDFNIRFGFPETSALPLRGDV